MSTDRKIAGTVDGNRVLVVDDDLDHAQMLRDVLNGRGYRAVAVGSAREAMSRVEARGIDVVVTDLRMPEMGGLELIEWATKHDPRVVLVAITAFGGLETAIKAVRAGAFDYLSKPFEPDALYLSVDKALHERAVRLELARLRRAHAESGGIVSRSEAMRDVMGVVQQVSTSNVSVLITGPAGVGKEVLARAIHARSERAGGPFVAVNCSAIPPELLDAELFGVKKGQTPDAKVDRPGLLRDAHSGTIFFDEIGDLPLGFQSKLLRALQTSASDVRVLAATRRDLRAELREQAFREDLFYRIAVVELHIPALRERPDDIPPLAEAALMRAAAHSPRPRRTLSGAAVRRLMDHAWPGNVRELENAIERAVALSQGDVILPEDLPPTVSTPPPTDFLRHALDRSWTLEDLSRAYLARVLERTGGNKKQAAAIMGIDRRTIQRWLGDPPEEREEEARRRPTP